MNDRDDLFKKVGRHQPSDHLRRRVMDEITLTRQEGRGGARPTSLRWFGGIALPVAASVALWLAMPTGVETTPTVSPPPAAQVAYAPLDDEAALASLDEIYGVETASTRRGYDTDTTLRAIYGVGGGDQQKETNDA